jgi:hypothetical protein
LTGHPQPIVEALPPSTCDSIKTVMSVSGVFAKLTSPRSPSPHVVSR